MTPKEHKQALRDQIRAAIAALGDDEKSRSATSIIGRIRVHRSWLDARNILLFSPLRDEPDIGGLLEKGLSQSKTICLPRYRPASGDYEAAIIGDLARDTVTGRYGIAEPDDNCASLPLNQLDLVLVPGVAFAACGSRLGRGRGFYDRILKTVSGLKLGVAFDEQIVDAIPSEEHDERVDGVVTPTRWME